MIVDVFSSLFRSLASFAGSSDFLFGFVFVTVGVLAVFSGIMRLLHV